MSDMIDDWVEDYEIPETVEWDPTMALIEDPDYVLDTIEVEAWHEPETWTEAGRHETHTCRDCGAVITMPYARAEGHPDRGKGYLAGRADALREAAERVRALPLRQGGTGIQTYRAEVLAILTETER